MKSLLFRPIVAASLLLLASAVQAAMMSPTVNAAGDFTAVNNTGPGAGTSYGFNVAPTTSPSPAIFYDTNVHAQSPNSIARLVAAAYGANPNDLGLVNSCDNIAMGCAGLTLTSNSGTLISAPFDYLAVQFGGGQLFFHWAQPITTVTVAALSNFPGGQVNYRAYLTTPIPGALALFVGALGMLGAGRRFSRRPSSASAPAMPAATA